MANKETKKAKARLEYLREQIEQECISYGEIAELQSLKEYIEPGDVVLLEWAGVPEEDNREYTVLVTYTEGGTTQVLANSPEQAKRFVELRLEEEGLDSIEIDPTHREWDVLEVDGEVI